MERPPASPPLPALPKAQFDYSFDLICLCLISSFTSCQEHHSRSKNYENLRKGAKKKFYCNPESKRLLTVRTVYLMSESTYGPAEDCLWQRQMLPLPLQ
jgi:hypothetical protein